MGRKVPTYRAIHENAGLASKKPSHRRHHASPHNMSTFPVQRAIAVQEVTKTNTLPYRNLESSTPSFAGSHPFEPIWHGEALSQGNGTGRTRSGHHKVKSVFGEKRRQHQPNSANMPGSALSQAQRSIVKTSRRARQASAAHKYLNVGEQRSNIWERALAQVAKEADNGAPCYHLLQENLEFDRVKGYGESLNE